MCGVYNVIKNPYLNFFNSGQKMVYLLRSFSMKQHPLFLSPRLLGLQFPQHVLQAASTFDALGQLRVKLLRSTLYQTVEGL